MVARHVNFDNETDIIQGDNPGYNEAAVIVLDEEDGTKSAYILEEIFLWLKENSIKYNVDKGAWELVFEHEADAAAFKLKWM